MEKDGPTFPIGQTFPRGRGSNCIFLYKTKEFVIFQGGWVWTTAPSSGSVVASLTEFVHTSSWPKDSMTLTPLMQVLSGWGKQRQGPTVSWLEIRLGYQ